MVNDRSQIVSQAYGLTEYSCVTLSHCGSGHVRGNAKLGSVGFIVPGIQLKFVDSDSGSTLPANSPGEICIRGASAMKGNINLACCTHIQQLRIDQPKYGREPLARGSKLDFSLICAHVLVEQATTRTKQPQQRQ